MTLLLWSPLSLRAAEAVVVEAAMVALSGVALPQEKLDPAVEADPDVPDERMEKANGRERKTPTRPEKARLERGRESRMDTPSLDQPHSKAETAESRN